MPQKIKASLKLIIKPLINKTHKELFIYSLRYKTTKVRNKTGYCIVLLATPCHGNLGDQAIVKAQYNFLTDIGLADYIVEIKNSDYIMYKDIVCKYLISDDIILIDGGGNLGTLWPHEDDKISEIIQNYIYNKIVVFPQTCYYSNDAEGIKRLERTKAIYSKHENLSICLRDKQSYDFVLKNFPTVDSIFVPDIVLYIDTIINKFPREGILLCFRKDLEKVTDNKEIIEIKKIIRTSNIQYEETDMLISKNVNKKNRDKELRKKWLQFSKSGLVITDRLHGMIFAAITGTPCIAIDNKSKKVSGVYNWISSLDYIKICEDISKIEKEIDNLYKGNFEYNKSFLSDNFSEISSKFIAGSSYENN